MIHHLTVELKRSIISIRFAFSVLLCATIYLLGSLTEMYSGNILYILDASVSYSAFYHLFPIVAVIPYCGSLIEDIKSGYTNFYLQRITKGQYLSVRFTTATLSGALATAGGMYLFLLFLPLSHPFARLPHESGVAVYEYMNTIVANRQWLLYFSFYGLLQGMSGMMWSSIGCLFASFVHSNQLIYLSVVLSMECLCRFLFQLGYEHIIHYATGAIASDSLLFVLWRATSLFFGISAICYIAFYTLGQRRLANA